MLNSDAAPTQRDAKFQTAHLHCAPPQSGADAEPFSCPPFDNPLFEDEDSEDEFGGCGMPSPDWGSAWSTDTKESTLSVGAAADCSSSSQEFDGECWLEGWSPLPTDAGCSCSMLLQSAARWVLGRWVLGVRLVR